VKTRNLLYRVLIVVILCAMLLPCNSGSLSRVARAACPVTAENWHEVGADSACAGGISNNSNTSECPSVAITPDGTPYVAWADRSGGNYEIYVRRWNGSSWEEVGAGSASGGGISDKRDSSDYPSVAIAPDGTPYVAWEDFYDGEDPRNGYTEIYVRRWNGSSWEEVGADSASGGGISDNIGESRRPSLAIAPDGTPYIAWYDDSYYYDYYNIYVRRWNGSSWEEVGADSASGRGISNNWSTSKEPSLAIAPNGTPYVAWHDWGGGDAPEIYVRRWNGSSWEEVGADSASGGGISNNSGNSWFPSVAIAPDGTPYVAWWDDSSGGDSEIYVRRWNGSSWEEVGAGSASGGGISGNSGDSAYPSLAIAPDGMPYVAWHDDSSGDFEIYVRRWNGSSWEEIGASSAGGGGISDNSGNSWRGSVAIVSDSTPYVAWWDDSGGNYEIYVRRWGGGTGPTYSIEGYVRKSDGTPIDNVKMAGFPSPYDNLYTNSNGYYLAYVPYGWSGSVTPQKVGWTFTPSSKTYSNVTSNQTQDYTGNIVAVPEVTILAPAEGAEARAGDTFLARASVKMDSAPATGAQVKATIPLGGPWAVSGSLYDDGQHEDGAKDDGIYAALLALPARITMPLGSYTLIVTAIVAGVSGADSVGFNVIGGYSGVPTVTVTLDGPNAPDFIRNDLMTIAATVTYPDASIHTDSSVIATLVLPDLTHAQIGLINVSNDTWRGTYTLPQGGHYWVDVRVEPPASTDFIDGYGEAEVDVYEGDLVVAPTSLGGPYPLYGRVPLSLCVTSGGTPFEEATILATVTDPNASERTIGSFSPSGPGCYEAVFSPRISGQHIVVYTATAYPYRPGTATLSFQVSTQSSRLASRVRDFGDDAILNADLTMAYIKESAKEGQYFANEREADERRLVAEAVAGLIFLDLEAFGVSDAAAEALNAYLPGSDVIFDSNLALHAESYFLAGVSESGTNAALEVTANHLRKGPAAFYAADGDAKDMLAAFENGGEIELDIQEDIAAANGFQNHFVDVLQPAVNKAKSDITTNTTNLAANLPPFTLGQEQAYMDDLDGRQEANWWLGPQAADYRRSPLHEAYERRTSSDFTERIASFLLWWGAKVAAFAICDGPCSLGVSAGKVFVDAIVNAERLSEDGRMMNLGVDVMEMGFWSVRRLWSNALSGLDVISRSESPDTPQGEIEAIDFRFTAVMGGRYYQKTSAYADITIRNTGSVTAKFFPTAYGENRDILTMADTLMDPTAPVCIDSVELAPGESTTVRLILYRNGWNSNVDDEPEPGSSVLINIFAQTDKGIYLVDDQYEESYGPKYDPEGLMSSGAQVDVQYLSEPQTIHAQANGEPDGLIPDFPLLVNLGTDKGSPTYNVWVLAHNPFPGPMTAVLSQTVPSSVEVLQVTDGAVSGGEIRWYKIIQPHESAAVGYYFRLAAGNFGNDITLPSVHMSYYDPVDDAMVTLSTGTGQVTGKLPLFAVGVPPQQIAPGTQTSVSVDVTNLDVSRSHQGSLHLSLMDLIGTEVNSTNASVSLSAGSSQTYPLIFTPTETEGIYILRVTLTQNSTTAIVFTTFVEAREQQVYLPLVLKNYTPGSNNLPYVYNPSPPDGATNQSVNVNLSWTGGDPDPGDTVTYDVYFEANDITPSVLICNDVSSAFCDPGTLSNGTHYYWQVIARDSHGLTTQGTVWDFTTATTSTPGWYEVGTGSATGGGISDNSSPSQYPSVAIAPDGTPYVAWFDSTGGDDEIYVRRWNGSSWEEVGAGSASSGGISDNSGDSGSPSMAVTPDGTPYVAWGDNSSGDWEIYVRRWNGSSWEEVGAGSASGGGISNNGGESVAPSVAIAPDGTPYIAWYDRSGGYTAEIYVRRWNGSSWEEVGAGSASGGGISDNSGNSFGPSVAIAPDGTPYIAWFDSTGGDDEIYVRRWNGSSWEEVGIGSATGGGISDNSSYSMAPSMAIASDGTPYVAWHDRSGDREIYVRYWNGSSWEEVGTGSATSGGISDNSGDSMVPSIAIAPEGTPYVAWYDYSGGDTEIYVRRWNGSSWEEVGAGSASGGGISGNSDSSRSPSMAITPDGTPYVAWYDNSGDYTRTPEIYVRRWVE